MRNLLLLVCVFLVTQTLLSQNLPIDSATGLVTFTKTIEYQISKEQAYKSVKMYFTEIKNFKLIFADSTFSKLSISGSTSVYYKKDASIAKTGVSINTKHEITAESTKLEPAGNISYLIDITFSTKALTFTVKNLIHTGTGEIGNGGPIEKYPECGSEKIGTIPNWELYKQQAQTDILQIFTEITSAIGKKQQ